MAAYSARLKVVVKVLDFVQFGGTGVIQTGHRAAMDRSWGRCEVVKDKSSTLRLTDDCHIAEDRNRMWTIRGLPEIHGAFDVASKLVEGDKFTVVSVHREQLIAIECL